MKRIFLTFFLLVLASYLAFNARPVLAQSCPAGSHMTCPPCATDPNGNTYGVCECVCSPDTTASPSVTVQPTCTPRPACLDATPSCLPPEPEGGFCPAAPTIPAGNTSFSFDILLHGIGKGGDSANPVSSSLFNPLHPVRQITIEVFNSQNQLVLTRSGSVSFNQTNGNFQGTVDMGGTLTTGIYTVKVKTDQFLKTLIPGIQNIAAGSIHQLGQVVLINGDVNGDNVLNVLDYNILLGCYSDFMPPVSCTPENKLLSDLGDDGNVNQFDYNLFLRELTNLVGQ